MPRPLASALHAQRPNEVVHLDYLYMGPSSAEGPKYVLLLKDDLSSFAWLFPTAHPDAENAVSAMASWIATFGGMDWIVSDQG